MDKLDRYKIDLRSVGSQACTYEWHIDGDFFADVQSVDIQSGEVDVCLKVKPVGDAFELLFSIEGEVQVACDRCLEPMTLPVRVENKISAKWGDEYDDDGDMIVVPEGTGEVNVAWNIYEFISLEVPLRHVHPEGQCTALSDEMMDRYVANEPEAKPVDDRWSELKKILDNNK